MNHLPVRERTIFEVSKEGPDHLGHGSGHLGRFICSTWNVQNMLDLWFSEAFQNLSSFIYFHCFIGGLCTLWTCVKLKTSNSFSGVLQRTCMLFAVAQMQKRLWRLKHKITNLELFGPSFFVRAWTTNAWWRNRLH